MGRTSNYYSEGQRTMGSKKPGCGLGPCKEPNLGDRFPDYLDGLVRADEAKKIDKHLEVCTQCRLELDILLASLETGGAMSALQARFASLPTGRLPRMVRKDAIPV